MPAVVLVAVVLVVALLAGCSSGHQTDTTADGTRLTIRAWPNGAPNQPVRSWTLACPAGGTLPQPERACRLLDGLRFPFQPLARGRACTQIYGGPAEAIVTGVFQGRPVHADFSRSDGCQIARWNRIALLFPGVATG